MTEREETRLLAVLWAVGAVLVLVALAGMGDWPLVVGGAGWLAFLAALAGWEHTIRSWERHDKRTR